MNRTVAEIIAKLPSPNISLLPAPLYRSKEAGTKLMFAVELMRRHTTDEGWQLSLGLQEAGYLLEGKDLSRDGLLGSIDTLTILDRNEPVGTVVVQDRREWDPAHGTLPVKQWARSANISQESIQFINVDRLAKRDDLFRLTVIKDAHWNSEYQRSSADLMGAHAWIIYYHPKIVKHVAPFVREEHLIRTYHTVDKETVPPFRAINHRKGTLLSGAMSHGVYPLRTKLRDYYNLNPSRHRSINLIRHPGYQANKCHTPQFLRDLSCFRVSICTSSIYGYTLRKLIESTACGCRVITDLPIDDPLPHIDNNFIRVPSTISPRELFELAVELEQTYEGDKQSHYARLALDHYDYRIMGKKLAEDIEKLRSNYS